MRRYSGLGAAAVLALGATLAGQTPVELAANKAVDTQQQTRTGSPPKVPKDTYVIGVDDILAISVWKEPDLSRTLPVRPDGKITLPLVGDVEAGGKTPDALQKELHDRLSAYVSVPEVTVIVQEVKSLKYNIVGQ